MCFTFFSGQILYFVGTISGHAEKDTATVILPLNVTPVGTEQQFSAELNKTLDIFITLAHITPYGNGIYHYANAVPVFSAPQTAICLFFKAKVSRNIPENRNFSTAFGRWTRGAGCYPKTYVYFGTIDID